MKPIFNKTPLTPNTLSALPMGAIRPEGWLLDTMRSLRNGLFADYAAQQSADGAWKCAADGDCARAMYFLEAVIALGWTLGDDALKQRAEAMVSGILESQREDGWFGPEDNADYWPRMLALRALRMYFTATNDKRVLKLMDRFFKYEYASLAENPLREWAVARGGENMEIALWLYNITGQKYLIDLCKRLKAQTLDWPNYFHTFSTVMPMNKSQKWSRLEEALVEEKNEPMVGEKRPYFHSQFHFTHGTNIAIGLKTPGVINQFKSGFKEQGGFRFGWEKLMKHHGLANGIFSCDKHLNGSNPSQGSALEAVAELMNSLEALGVLGDFGDEPADALEKLAYNALPAAFTPDLKKYQRQQQVNQIEITHAARRFYNAGDDANLFRAAQDDNDCAAGLTAWPKFTSALWCATNDGGLAAVSYAPCSVRFAPEGVPAKITVSGGYPFLNKVKIAVTVKQPVEFPLYLRIPFWARQPMIYLPDGEIMQVRAGESACVRRKWLAGDELTVEIPAAPRVTRWYHQSGAVEVGPLLMALKPEYEWKDDGETATAETDSDWNFAILRDEPMKLIQIEVDVSAFGVGESAVGVMIKAAYIDWQKDGADCASVPMAPKINKESLEILELVPYGDAALRVTEFPMGALKEEKTKEIL